MKIGKHEVNNWVVIGGGVGVVAVVYFYKKSANSAAANSSTASTSTSNAIDPLTGLPYTQDSQIDPLTGMTYLSEAQEYGSVQAAESAVQSGSSYGAYGYGTTGYYGTAGYPTTNVNGSPPTTGTSFANNAQWAQAVQSGLAGLGYSSTDVASALGLYLNNMPLGTLADGVSAVSIVQAAVAEYGPPPVGSFTIIQSGTTTPPPTVNNNVTVPNVVGQSNVDAQRILKAAGFKVSAPADYGPKGSVMYITSEQPAAGTSVAPGTTILLEGKENLAK
jgi:hypothetical protein